MPIIDIEGVGLVEFPDTMDDAQIQEAIETDILKLPKKEKGFFNKLNDAFINSSTPQSVVKPQAQAKPSTFAPSTEAVAEQLPTTNQDRIQKNRIAETRANINRGATPEQAAQISLQNEDIRQANRVAEVTKPTDLSYAEGLTNEQMDAKTNQTAGGFVQDLAVNTAKGVIGLPQAAVGILDIPTMGYAGKLAEDAGIRFEDTQKIMDGWQSEYGQESSQSLQNADGVMDTLGVIADRPSIIPNTVAESLASIFGGGAIGKALVTAIPKVGAVAGAAFGEGAIAAGAQAEGIRTQTKDGLLTPWQSTIAGATGVGVGVIGAIGGKIAKELGINDVDTLIVGGEVNEAAVKKGLARKVVEAGFQEGILEEMPQSSLEQMLSNVALNKPIMEGVPNAATLGAVTGAAMGVGGQFVQRRNADATKTLGEPNADVPKTRGQRIIDKIKEQKGIKDDAPTGELANKLQQQNEERRQQWAGNRTDENLQEVIDSKETGQWYKDAANAELERRYPTKQGESPLEQTAVGNDTSGDKYVVSTEDSGDLEVTVLIRDDAVAFADDFSIIEYKKSFVDSLGGIENAIKYNYEPRGFIGLNKKQAQPSEAIDISELIPDEVKNVSDTNTDAGVVAGNDQQPSANSSGSVEDTLQGNGSLRTGQDSVVDNEGTSASVGEGDAVRTADTDSNAVSAIDEKANEAATSQLNDLPEPTQAQKEAGNYKVGRISVNGLNISVENPDQSQRKGVDRDGKEWSSTMNGHYGYVKGVKARAPDKEHVDVNVKPSTPDNYDGDVFVINQKDPKTGKFDEPKAYIGYASEQEAEQAYRSNYADDWQGFDGVARVSMVKFKEMLNDEKAFMKPVKVSTSKQTNKYTPTEQKSIDVYKKIKQYGSVKGNKNIREGLWLEQLDEQIENPNRYHLVKEEPNPKNLEIGDYVSSKDGVLQGYVASISVDNREKDKPRYSVLIRQLDAYGGWSSLDSVDKVPEPDFKKQTKAQTPESQMSLDEFKAHKRGVNKKVYGKEEPFDDKEMALQHLDYIKEALSRGQEVPDKALSQHSMDDINQYKSIKKLVSDKKSPVIQELAKKKAKARKPSNKPVTLLSTMKALGGLKISEKQDITGEKTGFAAGGYNQIFRNDGTKSLKGVIESGALDDYLPPSMRLSANGVNDDAYDSTEAYDYLVEFIRNGERVLPYDVMEELERKRFENQDTNVTIEAIADEFNEDEINAELQAAGYDEREAISLAQDFDTGSKASGVTGSQGSQERTQGSTANNTPSEPKSQERGREQVTAIVLRRKVANELGKLKQFDEYLAAAKRFMAGEKVSPTQFKMAAGLFKSDEQLNKAYTALAEMAKVPAKEARKEQTEAIDTYKQIIANAKTVAELQSIARDIQAETTLSDANMQMLDDLAMDAIDALENSAPKKELVSESGSVITSPLYVGLYENGYTMLRLDDKDTYVDKGGNKHRTFVKDGVKVALNAQQILFENNGRAIYGYGESNDVILLFIGVDEGKRGKGLAKEALGLISSIADDKKLNVYIEPVQLEKKGIAKEQLAGLYEKYGFKWQGDAQKVMVRKPNEVSYLISEQESADIDRRQSIVKAKLEAMQPDEVKAIYAKANLAGAKRSTNELIETLSTEHPDDIEPLLQETKTNKTTDLLGDDTKAKQAIADAQREKDAKRNTGIADTEGFTLTGSNSEADKAIAMGAQDLFAQPAKPSAPPVDEKVKKAQDDLNSALGDLGDIFGKNFRDNITPEQEQKLIPVLTRVFDAAFRLGYYEFKAAAKFVLDTIRSKISPDVADIITLDQLQGAYISMAGKYGDQATKKRDVVNVESIAEIQESNNVTDERSGTDLERNSQDTNPANTVGETGVQAQRNGTSGTRGQGVQRAQENGTAQGSLGLFDSETVVTGERGNIEIYTGASPTPTSLARDNDNRGSGDSSLRGTPIEPPATERINEVAKSGLFTINAQAEQKTADVIPQERTLENIRATLPLLKAGQQEDVFKAESKFAEPDGYGMLFTNGTGTGKTFTGMGVIKRFANAGKNNIIVIAPNDKIIEDWQNTGKLFNLKLNRLDSTNDAGQGIVITTYANFGANETLADREWDLVVTDEAHYLAMDKDGTNTNALKTLRAITNNPVGAITRYEMQNREMIAEAKRLSDAILSNNRTINNDDTMDSMIEQLRKSNERMESQLSDIQNVLIQNKETVRILVKESQGINRTRALFLSATPFAYEKTVDWANGYLFDYDEGKPVKEGGRAYNEPNNMQAFFIERFGYRMRYNKLTAPDAKVNSGLMQRQFNTWLKKRGTLSGRMLDVEADYDRKFILVDSAIGRRIDEALQWFEDKRGETKEPLQKNSYSNAQKLISEQFDYLSRRYLLEAIKAKEVIVHVKEHMALGRKVVVFHDYKKGGGFNPFDIKEIPQGDPLLNGVISQFRSEFKDLIASPEFNASSPINAFQQAFPNVLLFNGDVPTKIRRANVAKFQDDNSGPQVILVQSAAGKEGISLHDTTGKHQRVLFNLGQPTQPTTSIQQEGRIYRTGQVTDAIFRYLNTGTNWERWAFATTIAQRASAAENLALGEQARALKDAFISGFEESDNYRAGMEGEGKGGKERDKAANEALTEYDRAKAFYYGTQKKSSKTKAQEGADYYATPEPVGLKMVELADIRPGERVLEPSAGHGAIARWFPEGTDKTAIEPSGNLRPRLAMVFDGSIIGTEFEDLNIINKYDAIIMNPPFGSAGKTAIDHVAKAARHLNEGGRIVALIPVGSTDQKFDKWFYETETRPIKPVITTKIREGGIEMPIYKGDMVETRLSWLPPLMKVVRASNTGGIVVKVDGNSQEYDLQPTDIFKVQKTGARTEEYSPAEGLSLVADIKLPSVTFERAGTAVNTRIVVIEKSENAPQQTNRDYTQVTDINDLFNRMETLEISERAKPKEQDNFDDAPAQVTAKELTKQNDQAAREREAKALESGAIAQSADAMTFKVVGDKLFTNAPMEKVTTNSGKELEGVFITDPSITLSKAKEVDRFAYYPKGKSAGIFVRLRHVERPSSDADFSNSISQAKTRAITAQKALDKFYVAADAEGLTVDEFSNALDTSMEAFDTLVKELAAIPNDGFALQGKGANGQTYILAPSAKKIGAWQLSRFDNKGASGDTQFDSKTQAIKRLLEDADISTVTDYDATFSNAAPIFYSALRGAIEAVKVNKADRLGWKGMIKNLTQKGVKQDEIEWTGINEWLDLQTGSITKEQVLDYLSANGVQVTETMLGLSEPDQYELPDGWYTDQLEDGTWVVRDDIDDTRGVGDTENEAIENSGTFTNQSATRQGDTKYEKYTVAGGTNYKELLLTLPDNKSEAVIKKIENDKWIIEVNGKQYGYPFPTEQDARNFRAIGVSEIRKEQNKNNYKSKHWDEPNILAHVRFDERTDADGNKVLFINEIQSDWGQDGKKKGFGDGVTIKQDSNGYYRAYNREGSNIELRVNGERYVALLTEQAVRDALPSSYTPSVIPTAPFVTKTDAWVSLAIKRMMRYAVDNGFDKVAFINGQQAADLYDLSKQVDAIHYQKRDNGNFDLNLEKNGAFNAFSKNDLSEKELVDFVGKEVADKIVKGEGEKDVLRKGVNTLSGIDLKVGGNGMRTFYDQIVPKVANDVLKKVGGGKVETMPLGFSKTKGEITEQMFGGMATYNKLNASDKAKVDAEYKANTRVQTAITITPAMRETVAGGLPLFRAGGTGTGLLVDDIKKAIANTTFGQDVDIYPTMMDAPVYVQYQAMSEGAFGVEGFFDKRTNRVAIVAENIKTMDRVTEVVRHELIGHYGMENMLNDADPKLLPRLINRVLYSEKSGNKTIQEIGKYVDKSQPGLSDKRRAKEIIAVMAERNLQNDIVKRVIDAIRLFLRKFGLLKQDVTDAKIAGLLRDAQAYLKAKGQSYVEPQMQVSYSVQEQKAFSDSVDDVFNGKAKSALKIGNTPAALVLAGVPDVPMMVTQSVVDKIYYDHGISKTIIKSLPELLSNPVMVFESDTQKGSFVVMLDRQHKGEPIVAVLKPNGNIERVAPVNVLTTAYTKPAGVVEGWIKKGLLLGSDKKKALEFATTNKLQLPAVVQQINKSVDVTIRQNNDGVNLSNNNQTETPAFKKWFGNSKVVDAEGKPLVMYHGTWTNPKEFKRGENEYGNVAGFFTPNPTFAEQYVVGYWEAKDAIDVAEKSDFGVSVQKVYISAKKPWDYENKDHVNQLAKELDKIGIDYEIDEFKNGDYRALESDTLIFDTIEKLGFDAIWLNENGTKNIAVFNPNQIKSATGNNGNFDGGNDDISFSNNPQSRMTPQWETIEDSKMDNVVRALQDKYIDLKRVTQNIKQAGVEITDKWNAYLQEELFHGRTAKRVQDFLGNHIEPLIEDMRTRGVEMTDFEEYLWMRHAEERNIQISKINPDMQDGGSGLDTEEARAYLAGLSTEQKANYEALAKRIDTITGLSRQALVDYGLESAGTILKWQSTYKNYVPLMREDMEVGFGNGTGSGYKVKGNASRRATGSNRPVVDIIANLAQQYERNIIRGEKNRVSTALIGLATLNPNEEFWQVDTPPTVTDVSKATGLVETRTDPNYKNRPNVVVARVLNKRGEVVERSVLFNQGNERAMSLAKAINNVDADRLLYGLGTISKVTRYFASINTQYNPIFGVVNITRDVQGALLNLETTAIRGKQKEVMKNTPKALLGIYRDVRKQRKGQGSDNTDWAQLFEDFQKEGGQTGYRNMFSSAQERSEAMRKALDPTWWQNTKIGKVISAGGKFANAEQWIADKAVKPIFDWLTDYNLALENAVRLSVYKVSLDNGLTKQQAASIAKNISVNFNRKGQATTNIGALYAFFNASVQGTARIGETLTKRDANGKIKISGLGAKIVTGGLLLGGMQALALAMAGYDEDEPPDFVRDRNLVIPLDMFGADQKYISIPMPLGFNAIPAIGRITTEWALSGFKDTSKRLIHMLDMMLDVTNPIGNAGLSSQTFMPTAGDPFAALDSNKDFTGRDIAVKDFNSLNPTPGHSRARDTATEFSKATSYAINKITGGTEFTPGAISPTPDQIDYLIGQFTGGVGREYQKIEQTFGALVSGEELPPYKMPLVGRFYGNAESQGSQGNKFYSNLREINKHESEIKGRRETGQDVGEYIKDNPTAMLYKQANMFESTVKKMRKRKDALLEANADKEKIAEVENLITQTMQRFNALVESREQANQPI